MRCLNLLLTSHQLHPSAPLPPQVAVRAGALVLLLIMMVNASATTPLTSPPRKLAATSGGPDVEALNWPRTACAGFTTGAVKNRCGDDIPACCTKNLCQALANAAAYSFSDCKPAAGVTAVACCPYKKGEHSLIWSDKACPGQRIKASTPPNCPAKTVWACCAQVLDGQGSDGNACIRFKERTGCINPDARFGCCPV